MRPFPRVLPGFAAIAFALTTGCSDKDSTPPNNTDLSSAEARAVASALFSEMARAIGSPTPSSVSANATTNVGPTVTANISSQCSAGGTLNGNWTFNNDVNGSGTGTKSGTVTFAASNCNISTGQRTITTNGSYTFTFAASFTNHLLSSNFVWNGDGDFAWSGGSCTLDYSVTITPQGRRSLSGTICGVTVDGTVD